jgi:signal transduction histidine kinase
VTFIITLIIGIFLIKSVIKEVSLREEIQKIDEELKIANQGQANLIRFMNHQVKGRLGNVKNIFAELLTDDYGLMPSEAKSLLHKGLEEANLGVNYVQSILKGASAEKGTLSYEMKDLDFKEVVRAVAEEQKSFAEEKGLYFNINLTEGNYSIVGDNLNLSEAIKNLIDNSIHYTLEGGIDVNIESKEKEVILKVKDTGIGLSPNDKSRLFKSGGRGEDSLKINVNSTGYGLAFVKGVVVAHGGKAWAESEGKGKGSLFVIELPKK